MKLITVQDCSGGYVNDLTKAIDKYLKRTGDDINKAYIYTQQMAYNHWALTCTNTTRGHILVDDSNIIIDIIFFSVDSETNKSIPCLYSDIKEVVTKFIGVQMTFS